MSSFWLGLVLMLALGYWIAMNEIAYRQRGELLKRCFDNRDWVARFEQMAAFERVSYQSHMLALMLWRDPWKLYSPQLQALMGKER